MLVDGRVLATSSLSDSVQSAHEEAAAKALDILRRKHYEIVVTDPNIRSSMGFLTELEDALQTSNYYRSTAGAISNSVLAEQCNMTHK